MINLASRDVLAGWGRYLATGLGLGLLIGVTLTMAGVYRGMVADGIALVKAMDADLWVVQPETRGPFAEPSTLSSGLRQALHSVPGVRAVGGVAFLTLEVTHRGRQVRLLLAGYERGRPGGPTHLLSGRPIVRPHYEMVADVRTGFRLGERVTLRRHDYRVVGLTSGARSTNGDPVAFLSLADAQEIQFLPDNDTLFRRRKTAPGEAPVSTAQVNAVLIRLRPGYSPEEVAAHIRRWWRLAAHTRQGMRDILVEGLVATMARQIGLFLFILTLVSTAVVALTVYAMTQGKLREIAVLKLIGAPNRLIVAMIVQEALGLGVIGFLAGRLAVTYWAPLFPKHVVLLGKDTVAAMAVTFLVCLLASLAGIRSALRVSPASAIGGGG